MKKFLLAAAMLLLSPLPAFAAGAPDVVMTVNGLVCDVCAQSIIKLMEKNGAVEKTAIDLENGLVTVDFKDGQTMSDAAMTKIITYAGYDVVNIKRP